MNKNIKSIFFVTILLVLLLGVGTLSAADISNDTTTVDSNDNIAVTDTATDTPVKSVDTTTSKNIKKEEQTTDFYVSDTDGSDDNSGTSTSPYKTIQKALDNTNTDTTYNIYLAKGTYKGLGNTNLTVNGNYTINFIGEDNAVIDGEVNYTEHITQDNDYFWGSSKDWEPFDNGTGNWAFNITRGTGLITISNLTIQNCWNPGTSHILGYNTSTIDNYGNLEVSNVSFIFNHGGVGASIRNNNGGTLTVFNSLFDGNRKSSSTGNYGAGIYNNGTATIINSTFQNNYARWGTVTNDHYMSVINSTFMNNKAYDGSSQYKTGAGITADTKTTDFYTEGDNVTKNQQTTVDNCLFINNEQADIYGDNLIINNSIFNQSTGIYYISNSSITNNIFDSPIGSTIENSLSSDIARAVPAYLRGNSNMTNNTFLNNKVTVANTYDLRADYGYNIITNNSFSRSVYITYINSTFTNNIVNTTQDIFAVTLNGGNHTVTDNYLVSTGLVGNEAVSYSGTSNIVKDNLPEVTSITVSEDNFNQYFENGQLRNEYININTIKFNGTLSNHDLIFDLNHPISITNLKTSYNQNNFTITIKNGTTASISQLKINNTNNKEALIIESENNSITKNTIQTTFDYTMNVTTTGNTITGNTLYAEVFVGNDAVNALEGNIISSNTPTYVNYLLNDITYSDYFDENGYYNYNLGNNVHFMINGILSNKDIVLQNSTINITKRNDESIMYNTTITSKDSNVLILNNAIIKNSNKKLALNISTISPTIQYNTIITDDTAIYMHDYDGSNTGRFNIQTNNITVNATNTVAIKGYNITSYSQSSSMGHSQLYNNTINVYGNNITAIEIYNSTFSSIYNNTINAIGENVIAINLTNDEKRPLNVSVSNRRMMTTTVVSANTINIKANNNAIGLLTNNMNIAIARISFTIASNNTAIGWKLNNTDNHTSFGNGYGGGSNPMPILNISALNQAIGISATGYCDVYMDYLNITLDGFNIIGIDLTNTTKEYIGKQSIKMYGQNNTALNIINSSKIVVEEMQIIDYNINSTEDSMINIENSQSIIIRENTIKTAPNYTIFIINSTDSKITQNSLYSKTTFGDNTIYSTDNIDTYTSNNKPEQQSQYLLTDSNYNDFFDENGILLNNITDNITIQQVGDIANKNMTINKKITYIQSPNTKLYNTTITANNDNIVLKDLNMANQDKDFLIINSNNNIISNINIELTQSTTKTNPIIINGNNNTITSQNINITGTKDETEKTIEIFTINGQYNIVKITKQLGSSLSVGYINYTTYILLNNTSNNNILINKTYNSNYMNKVSAFVLNNSNYNNITYLQTGSINSLTGNVIELTNSSHNKLYGRTDVSHLKNNNVTCLSLNDNSNNNFISMGLNGATGTGSPLIINNSHNNTIKASEIYSNYIYEPIQIINSNNNEFLLNEFRLTETENIAINISEGYNNNIHHNLLKTKTRGGDTAVLQEVIGEYNIQNPVNNNYYQKSTQWNIPYDPLVISISTNDLKGYIGETIAVEIQLKAQDTQSNTPTLPVNNGTLNVIINDEITSFEVSTDKTYTLNYTITNDTNQQIIIDYYGDSSYYESKSYTANVSIINVLTDENYDQYFTDSVIDTEITTIELGSDLHNKDLILNTKVNFLNPNNYTLYNSTVITGPNSLSNINIINDDDKEIALLISNNTVIQYANIIQNGDYKQTVVFEGLGGSIQYSNITINGKNNVLFSGSSTNIQNNAVTNNIINVNGNKTQIIDATNYMNFRNNNITYNSNNTSIFNLNRHLTNQLAGYIGGIMNITGNNLTIVNTSKYQLQGIVLNANITGDNITAIQINDVQKSFTLSNNNIRLNTNTPTTLIKITNSILNIKNNQIIMNNTQENTPIIQTDDIYPISVTNNYLESQDVMGNNAVSGASTINENTPNGNGEYRVNIAIDKDTVVLNHENTITITVTNVYNEEISGELTATANNQTVEVVNNTITWIPTRETFNPPTIDFQNIIENQTITTGTSLSQSTLINNTTINLPDTTSLSSRNSLYTRYGQTYLINNSVLNTPIYQQGTLYIYNSVLNGTIGMSSGSPIYVDDNTIIGENLKFTSTSTKVFTNNKALLELLNKNGMTPQNNPIITVTYTDPEGKYATTTINKTFKTTEPQLTIDPNTTKIGDTINITARIIADKDTLTDINTGKIVFKVNGKTLKDANGKIIYAKVINGTATIENYEVPEDWIKDGTTIQAVYSGSTQCDKLTSEKTNMTVNPKELTLTTTATQAAPGQTTTQLTATLSDNTINTGKIVFKINGKTVKDANGKVIYAKVTNGTVSVDYTLPESYKAGNYTVTATFIASGYDKLEAETTLTVAN